MTMRKFNFVALFLISVGFATAVQAHAMLDHASPPVGGTVGSSPGQVTLYFTQQLEPKFSGAEVRNASGARVDHGKSISGNVMRLSVGTLAPGAYSVTWRVLSVDTHTTQGSFSFHVGR
jgi:methionine-rich copper-binding protein CopC